MVISALYRILTSWIYWTISGSVQSWSLQWNLETKWKCALYWQEWRFCGQWLVNSLIYIYHLYFTKHHVYFNRQMVNVNSKHYNYNLMHLLCIILIIVCSIIFKLTTTFKNALLICMISEWLTGKGRGYKRKAPDSVQLPGVKQKRGYVLRTCGSRMLLLCINESDYLSVQYGI